MEALIANLVQYGLLVVFLNVFLEQIGAPIPAVPTLIVAGALAARGQLGAASLLAVAVLGAVLADMVWFFVGRWQGHRILKTVCRLSLSPDSCVRGTEELFERAGMPSLLYAKFIPGYNTVAPPLAGAMGTPLPRFLAWDVLGSLLWSGLAVGIGFLFHRAVDRAIEYLETLGLWALAIVGTALVLVVAFKWWQRRRVRKLLDLARITAAELKALLDADEPPAILDVRNRSAHLRDPRRLPGALRLTLEELEQRIEDLPRERYIVLYCA
jgi:membrane protein DedA with SNARE-associated domain